MPEISLDSFHPETIERALNESTIDWVNDVSGDSVQAMASLLKGSPVRYVTMHNLGVPPSSSKTLPPSTDPIAHLREWSLQRVHLLETLGLSSEQIIVDVGIGFGLTTQQNWQVLQSAGSIKAALSTLHIPVLVGHSRKSFLKSSLIEDTLEMRDVASSLIAFHLAHQNIDYLRIHAVPLMNQTIKIFSQLNR
jgi:dihydropteroate synthase